MARCAPFGARDAAESCWESAALVRDLSAVNIGNLASIQPSEVARLSMRKRAGRDTLAKPFARSNPFLSLACRNEQFSLTTKKPFHAVLGQS